MSSICWEYGLVAVILLLYLKLFLLLRFENRNEFIWARSHQETVRVLEGNKLLSTVGYRLLTLTWFTNILSVEKGWWTDGGNYAKNFPPRCSRLAKKGGYRSFSLWRFANYRFALDKLQRLRALVSPRNAKIWLSVEQDYGKFGDLVGWISPHRDSLWQQYSNLNFSLNAPVGHLPAAPFFKFCELAIEWIAYLSVKAWRLLCWGLLKAIEQLFAHPLTQRLKLFNYQRAAGWLFLPSLRLLFFSGTLPVDPLLESIRVETSGVAHQQHYVLST